MSQFLQRLALRLTGAEEASLRPRTASRFESTWSMNPMRSQAEGDGRGRPGELRRDGTARAGERSARVTDASVDRTPRASPPDAGSISPSNAADALAPVAPSADVAPSPTRSFMEAGHAQPMATPPDPIAPLPLGKGLHAAAATARGAGAPEPLGNPRAPVESVANISPDDPGPAEIRAADSSAADPCTTDPCTADPSAGAPAALSGGAAPGRRVAPDCRTPGSPPVETWPKAAPRASADGRRDVADGRPEEPPTVHVTIGRIEVRVPAAPPAAVRAPAPPRPRLSLDEYALRRREGRYR